MSVLFGYFREFLSRTGGCAQGNAKGGQELWSVVKMVTLCGHRIVHPIQAGHRESCPQARSTEGMRNLGWGFKSPIPLSVVVRLLEKENFL